MPAAPRRSTLRDGARSTLRRFVPWLCWLLLGWAALLSPATAAPELPRAHQGQIDIPYGFRGAVPLNGEWAFSWQKFVDPDWREPPASGYAAVPSPWNEITLDGKLPGGDGWGSYALRVNCPEGETLAVEAFAQRTASRLYINGLPVAAHGNPGPGPDRSYAAVHKRTPITREFACPLRLTLHVSNFDHRAGGFVRPLIAGSADALGRERELRIAAAAFLQSAYLLTGLVALLFYAVRRKERTALQYGLFCLAMCVYTDAIRERILLRMLPDALSWVAFMRLEYLSWIAAMALFMLTLRALFPDEIHRRAVVVVEGLLGLGALAVLLLPPGVYSHTAVPGQVIAVLIIGYLAHALWRAQRRSPVDARILLAGMSAVLVTQCIDLLLIDSSKADLKTSPMGFALFLLSPAIVIGRRLSRALNAEERNRHLEENARLREDVERISRHDMRTPLNSILGSARLLRDDPRLVPDQIELVGVLQRAGLRLLEMVNLSLGLYRMETGSYQFEPQPVDLREVTTRVLVDLQTFATSNGVFLDEEAASPGPVFVRAEDLLCYSIIANLVKNAIEATGAGERVSVAIRPGDPTTLAVHNPGVVPPTVASRFFEKYVTSGKSGGTGLGTYSARLMARAQQGDLRLDTDAQHGTTVTLTLRPMAEDVPVPTAAPVAPAITWDATAPRREVVMADDDELNRVVTRRMLPNPPFHVRLAADGHSAMELMRSQWPDIAIVDMEMPVADGIEVVLWLREREREGRPRCGVIMLSGNDDAASLEKARAAGVDRYLAKPVGREALLAALRELEDAAASTPAAPAALPDPAAGHEAFAVVHAVEDNGGTVVTVEPEWAEIFPTFVRYQRTTVDSMAEALTAGDRAQVGFLAHRAAGGLSMMGLEWASAQCRRLEATALDASADELRESIEAMREHLGKVRVEVA